MANPSKFLGAGFAQGLGQSIAQLPQLLLTMQQQQQAEEDRKLTLESQKLQNNLLKLKTREFDLQQKQQENAQVLSGRLLEALIGGGGDIAETLGGGGAAGGMSPNGGGAGMNPELAGFAESQGLPAQLFPQDQPAAPAGPPAGGPPAGGLMDRFDVEIGFDPKTGQLFPKTFKPKELPDPGSKVGKLIQDRQNFINQFGEGSPQVKALDEAISGERRKARSAGLGEGAQPPKLSDEKGIRTEFTSQASDFVKVRDSFARIKATTQNVSPAGDLSLMFNYMKMLDPGSVVRESEFATVAATGSLGQQIQAGVERVQSGKRLTPEQRQDFLTQARALFDAQLDSHRLLEDEYRDIAKRSGVSPDKVIVDFVGKLRSQKSAAKATGSGFDQLPNPATLAGKTVVDNETGMKLKSDGQRWIPVP